MTNATSLERPELAQASAALTLDADALASYLIGRLPGCDRSLRAHKFAGGQSNPTYKLEAGEHAWVLRKKPPGALLPTAHMVDREYRVMRALAQTDVPVPKALVYCADPSVIGTEFFVMEYLTGRIFWDPTLPEVAPQERVELYRELARVLAALHSVDIEQHGLSDYGKPGNYFARQIKRWSQQYVACEHEPIAAMQKLMAWLPEHAPSDDTAALVHGDYRLDNMIFHPTQPRVLGVLDWELSTLGHPLADLAYACMPYRLAPVGGQVLSAFASPASGIPSEADFVAHYCAASGRPAIDSWPFYLAFSLFRYASIVQGVYYRGLQGNASSGSDSTRYRERAISAANAGVQLIA